MTDLQDAANAPYVSQDEDGNTHYCPGCGRRLTRDGECKGSAEAPHPPIERVSLIEILNPPASSDEDATKAWQKNHTPAPSSAL